MKRIAIGVTALILAVQSISIGEAAVVDELKQKIDTHASTIQQLEKEIKLFQTELNKTTVEAKTLLGAVQALDLNSKKIGTDLKVTETKIDTTNLTIEQLNAEIDAKVSSIQKSKQALARSLQKVNETDSQSLLETVLTYPNLSDFWNQVAALEQFQVGVQTNMSNLREYKNALDQDKRITEQKKQELENLKSKLADQRQIVEVNKNEKSKLLTATKSKESTYKQIIADKEAKKTAFEKELLKFESELKIAIDPKSLPKTGTGTLNWPLANHRITQYFGNTEFSRANAAVYSGKGHNGIDLAAPVGTPILAAADGVIAGAGDTDSVCPGASYGKWVFIKHTNGLSTLYAHLSIIKATNGQTVSAGDIIGYSGNTGYSTGPHLHFTVYASQGVQIVSRPSQACGGTYTMPIADLKAYLNPLTYL